MNVNPVKQGAGNLVAIILDLVRIAAAFMLGIAMPAQGEPFGTELLPTFCIIEKDISLGEDSAKIRLSQGLSGKSEDFWRTFTESQDRCRAPD